MIYYLSSLLIYSITNTYSMSKYAFNIDNSNVILYIEMILPITPIVGDIIEFINYKDDLEPIPEGIIIHTNSDISVERIWEELVDNISGMIVTKRTIDHRSVDFSCDLHMSLNLSDFEK